jgi:hypothetical protein
MGVIGSNSPGFNRNPGTLTSQNGNAGTQLDPVPSMQKPPAPVSTQFGDRSLNTPSGVPTQSPGNWTAPPAGAPLNQAVTPQAAVNPDPPPAFPRGNSNNSTPSITPLPN